MKRSFRENTWRKNPTFKALCAAFVRCNTVRDVANLLRDVATLSEMQALSERLEVAGLLLSGLPYREVAQKTGASTATITRVAGFLNNGEGGYRKALGKDHRHHASAPAGRGRRR